MLTNIALYPGEEPGYEARLIMFDRYRDKDGIFLGIYMI